MTNVTPPRILEVPPRTTGNAQQDIPLLVDWFWKAYQIIVQAVNYVTGLNDDITENASDIVQLQADVSNLQTIMSRMIHGEATVSDTNTGFSVTFTSELPDDDYFVVVQAKSSTGTPTAESLIIAAKTYSTTGFSVTLQLAPGAGDSVTYDWQLIKNEVD